MNQEEHHKKVSFQDEYRIFLQKYKIGYDEGYVWDYGFAIAPSGLH